MIIHFSHANGFPAKTYRKLFSYLEKDFQIGYIDRHGHNPDYPVTDSWIELTKELIDTVERRYKEPVIGVGHSLGGVLTFMACAERPDLFKAFVMLDSPVLSPWRSQMVKIIKRLGMVHKIMPGGASKTRRMHWRSVEEAIEYFATKRLFKRFDPDCLRDYVLYGTEKTKAGIQLIFHPQIEYSIYITFPHRYTQYRRKLKVPGAVIYGKNSRVVSVTDRINMKKNFRMRIESIEGGHLFPFQYPENTANALRRLITNLIKTEG